jgi:hypothetical protein
MIDVICQPPADEGWVKPGFDGFRAPKEYEFLASSFDRLRMRSRVFKASILMASLSNHVASRGALDKGGAP